jgi:hypothetical protein
MKKLLFVTLLLSCLGASSLHLSGAAAAATESNSDGEPVFLDPLQNISIKWVAEKQTIIIRAAEGLCILNRPIPHNSSLAVPINKFSFLVRDKVTPFQSVKEYARRIKILKGDNEEEKKQVTLRQEKEKRAGFGDEVYANLQTIFEEFFNNDETLTNLSLEKMSILEGTSLYSESTLILQLIK